MGSYHASLSNGSLASADDVSDLREQLRHAQAETQRLRDIVEPPSTYFKRGNGFTLEVDLAIAEAITKANVSRNKVSLLFRIFARFFRIKLPSRKMLVPHKMLQGTMQFIEREIAFIPGRTHVQEVCAVLYKAHQLQIGFELLESAEVERCYISDGAESLQSEWLCQLLSRRDPNSGELKVSALDLSELHCKTAEAQHAAFKESLKAMAELLRDVGITDDLSPAILGFKPSSSMNDRAPTARKAAGLVRGSETDDPTCAHHAITNIFEAGRKAIDAVLRKLMNITDAQAAANPPKVKAMRTSVGWFSSPACAVIYQTCKYTALFSSKGYAVGNKFAKWFAADEAAQTADGAGADRELKGCIEDLLAVCGSRDYVFFMDAAVAERLSQEGSLNTYLEEETELGGETGGKLRHTILTGFNSEAIMSAVRALALICDACLWMLLRRIGSEAQHILDVLPKMWTETLAFFHAAAERPQGIVDGSCKLQLSGCRAAKVTERSKRAELDMIRIRGKANGNELVKQMLTAAFQAMADETKKHAKEFLPGGDFAVGNINAEERLRLESMPMTSTHAERMFAIGRHLDRIAGSQRPDTRAGILLAEHDKTVEWIMARPDPDAEWTKVRRAAREKMTSSMKENRIEAGLLIRDEREKKLRELREKRSAKLAKKKDLLSVKLFTRFSQIKNLSSEDIKEQLRAHKVQGKKGFIISHPKRVQLILQLQALMLDSEGAEANDLLPGDSGITGRGARRKQADRGHASKKQKRGQVCEYGGYEWRATEQFDLTAIVGYVIADGKTSYANQVRLPAIPRPFPLSHALTSWQGMPKAGTKLYRTIWADFPPDLLWYEPIEYVKDTEAFREYKHQLELEAQQDAGYAQEEADLEQMEEDEDLPMP